MDVMHPQDVNALPCPNYSGGEGAADAFQRCGRVQRGYVTFAGNAQKHWQSVFVEVRQMPQQLEIVLCRFTETDAGIENEVGAVYSL